MDALQCVKREWRWAEDDSLAGYSQRRVTGVPHRGILVD